MLNQRGMALMEIVPVLVLFAMLLNFSLGFFGIIHTGILNSIAARNYTFETLRNRADLNYLRDINNADAASVPYKIIGQRWHGIVDNNKDNQWIASRREIRFSEREAIEYRAGGLADHNLKVRQLQDEKRVSDQGFGGAGSDSQNGVNPVWVMSLYGICLNASCRP